MAIVVAIPKILREKLGDEGADALVELLDKVEERSKENIIELVEERFERRLAQLEAKIEKVRADLIKWMFIFWVGQIGVLTGILFAFFRG